MLCRVSDGGKTFESARGGKTIADRVGCMRRTVDKVLNFYRLYALDAPGSDERKGTAPRAGERRCWNWQRRPLTTVCRTGSPSSRRRRPSASTPTGRGYEWPDRPGQALETITKMLTHVRVNTRALLNVFARRTLTSLLPLPSLTQSTTGHCNANAKKKPLVGVQRGRKRVTDAAARTAGAFGTNDASAAGASRSGKTSSATAPVVRTVARHLK